LYNSRTNSIILGNFWVPKMREESKESKEISGFPFPSTEQSRAEPTQPTEEEEEKAGEGSATAPSNLQISGSRPNESKGRQEAPRLSRGASSLTRARLPSSPPQIPSHPASAPSRPAGPWPPPPRPPRRRRPPPPAATPSPPPPSASSPSGTSTSELAAVRDETHRPAMLLALYV
jgi:hypothetical protein